jgi:hypothetical protein
MMLRGRERRRPRCREMLRETREEAGDEPHARHRRWNENEYSQLQPQETAPLATASTPAATDEDTGVWRGDWLVLRNATATGTWA